jgi:hypothetical protein
MCRQLLQRLSISLLVQQQHHGLEVNHLRHRCHLGMPLAADGGAAKGHTL